MKISFVIPNYNGESLLQMNLPKLISAAKGAEIIVVDDASTDRSIIEIKNQKSKIKNIKLIQNEKNMGFASTVNRGVEEASGDLVVLLNTDVVPEKGFLESVLPHFEDNEVFAVGLLQKCKEEGKTVLRGRGEGSFLRGFLVHRKGEIDSENTLWVSGGAGVFRKKIWSELGGMNPLYNPFYWEDIDISYRALKSGYKLVFEKKAVVSHSQIEGAIRSNYSKNDITKIAYRNQIIFVWLNITDSLYLIIHFIYLPFHIIRSIVKTDWSFLQGLLLSILKIRKVILYRKRYGKLFLKNDREILK